MKKDIRDLTFEELKEQVIAMGCPAHRAQQIFLWLNGKNAASFEEMTDLPRGFTDKLKKKFYIGTVTCAEHLVSRDGTEKFLWQMEDGECVESVLIKEAKRRTVCLSTQVGCRFRCPFCASGTKGFIRDLRVSEIVNQLFAVQELCNCRLTNIVFMGMGEPLDNYDNLIKAIRVINHPKGINIGARKITVSTCGIIPGILKLKDFGLQIELSVSLHAANNRLRDKLVPANRKYPLEKLIPVCADYRETTGRVITLEYMFIKGQNDSLKDAEGLAGIAKRLRAKVNLMVCNPVPGPERADIDRERLAAFMGRVRSGGVTITLRRSRGADIAAACGQLAAKRGVRDRNKTGHR